MGEEEKILAKKFFLLLHLFLRRQYKDVDVVFVRHHEEAEECDEETFFTSRTSGGTVVSTAYEVVERVIADRYSPNDWNIYIAQASDGDNFGQDKDLARERLERVVRNAQFMAYIEISRRESDLMFIHETNLWEVISDVRSRYPQIAMQMIYREGDVISVFRKFFKRTKE
jgi:uncharacterized sporulation protein YeaH/YhbH (DUF444 family)